MNLNYFTQINLYHAARRFFAELAIPVNELTEFPAAADILPATYNPNNSAHRLMQDVYLIGGVDDSAFQHAAALSADSLKQQRYDGLLLFGVTLKERENGLLPTRSQLAEITRAFNREFFYTPVVVVFRYAQFISMASAERACPTRRPGAKGKKSGKSRC